MIVETLVEDILKQEPEINGPVGGRIFPRQLPDATAYPAIVVTKVSGNPFYQNGQEAGVSTARVQVDCYDDRGYAAAVRLEKAVRGKLSALKNFNQSGAACTIDSIRCINDTDMGEPGTERAGPRLRRRMLEFAVFYKEL